MTRLEHTVIIQKSLPEVYELAKQVERYPDFLPGYLESRIMDRNEDAYLLERAALVEGQVHRWKSWVTFEENRAIYFEHAEGSLQGMRVTWNFYSQNQGRTRVVITHRFHIHRPFGIAYFLEHFVYKPKINGIAALVVIGLKQACEKSKQEAVLI